MNPDADSDAAGFVVSGDAVFTKILCFFKRCVYAECLDAYSFEGYATKK